MNGNAIRERMKRWTKKDSDRIAIFINEEDKKQEKKINKMSNKDLCFAKKNNKYPFNGHLPLIDEPKFSSIVQKRISNAKIEENCGIEGYCKEELGKEPASFGYDEGGNKKEWTNFHTEIIKLIQKRTNMCKK